MGIIIDKYDLNRLGRSRVELAFDCPQCKKHRFRMTSGKNLDFWDGVRCPRCDSKIVLDSFSLAVIQENGGARLAEDTAATT